jgi:hypothetical protein
VRHDQEASGGDDRSKPIAIADDSAHSKADGLADHAVRRRADAPALDLINQSGGLCLQRRALRLERGNLALQAADPHVAFTIASRLILGDSGGCHLQRTRRGVELARIAFSLLEVMSRYVVLCMERANSDQVLRGILRRNLRFVHPVLGLHGSEACRAILFAAHAALGLDLRVELGDLRREPLRLDVHLVQLERLRHGIDFDQQVARPKNPGGKRGSRCDRYP